MTSTTYYDALRSRDRRFDGVFVVGVSTTMIYCRPVCRSRLPNARHCTFYRTAAEAENGGYRPCLRCRPELAPGRSMADATSRLANAALARIMDGAAESVGGIANELFVGERHLRRVMRAEFGASPIELAQTQRLLLAKQLLTETDLPVSRVAFASGFSSLSRFNTLFLSRYRMSPTRLRADRRTRGERSGDANIGLVFEYRPPLDWSWMLRFLGARATPGIEVVRDGAYMRSIRCGAHAGSSHTGWFTARRHPTRDHALSITVSESLVPALQPVRSAIRRLFDLDAEPVTFGEHFDTDSVMGPLARQRPGIRLPGGVDGFEVAVRAVLGQQVSVAAARTIAGRLHARYGERIDGPEGIERLPATAERLARARPATLSGLGMPLSRARTVVAMARAVVDGSVSLAPTADIEATISALQNVPGIGPWTAQYIAMRAFQWPDAFPGSDLGVRTALGGLDAMERAEAWRPWRAYATMYLWDSLSPNDE